MSPQGLTAVKGAGHWQLLVKRTQPYSIIDSIMHTVKLKIRITQAELNPPWQSSNLLPSWLIGLLWSGRLYLDRSEESVVHP